MLVVLGAIVWAWRGWSEPKLSNYVKAFISSLIMIGAVVINYNAPGLITINTLGAIIVLTLLEGLLGYGDATSELNCEYSRSGTTVDFDTTFDTTKEGQENKSIYFDMGLAVQGLHKEYKELWTYLGLISLCYSLLPFLVMFPYLSPICYLVVSLVGAIGFPFGKFADIYVQKNKKNTKHFVAKINKFIIAKLHILSGLDSWKVAEAIIGAVIILSWIIGIIIARILV
ncbi:MAG: hypothetical protein ACTSPD_09965 [Promethearchaeota archaeon]